MQQLTGPTQRTVRSADPPHLASIKSIPVRCAIALIQAYRLALRPLLIGHCKFCPTCSQYAVGSLRKHGLRRGGWLALRRICRCHPFTKGGIDPVPE
ncbi:MAG: membrane protein insertion efficiency factor YidD [Phycisphaerae bacterium]